MKIGIDCRTILDPENGEAAGIGHYNYQLVRHLLKIDKQNQYVLFFDRSVKEKRINKFKQKNVEIKYFPFSQYKRFLPFVYSNLLVSASIEREKLDIFHSPITELPPSYKGTSVVTVHDVAPFRIDNCFDKKECQRLQKIIPETLAKADGIITVSNSTKDDIEYLFEIQDTKIETIYNGLDQRFYKQAGEKDVEQMRFNLKIKGKYILYLGTLETRKNILGIVKAFEKLKQHKVDGKLKYKNYKLVLAGQHGRGIKRKLARIEKSEHKKDIIITGYVESDHINALYQEASAFVFPSFYEGFGFPVIEAMAKGVPVIAGNAGAIPEITGNAAVLVDPGKQKEITDALIKIMDNKELRQDLIEKGKKCCRDFCWEKTAQQTLDFYKKIVK